MVNEFSAEYFNARDTLECGQIFRYKPYKKGYFVISTDKACYIYTEDNKTYVESDFPDYFIKFFDAARDYSLIYKNALSYGNDFIGKAAKAAKGVRILNQDKSEMLYSFLISQNNHIPRIKAIIERLSASLGEKKIFMGEEYFSFPTSEKLAEKDAEFYFEKGLGYRAEYMSACSKAVINGFDLEKKSALPTCALKKELLTLKGVGPKVADCISLFGYGRTDCFPVDTWIEKIYHENFLGTLSDRNKITNYFTAMFQENSGFIQQYIFYYKRSLENKKQ